MNNAPVLAVFVSAHGFGHAARACAVMEAISVRNGHVRFEVFTTVPEAFFRESLGAGRFGYHPVATDVGFVQNGPFAADLAATAAALDRFLPFDPATTHPLAENLARLGCAAALCDISPLGIAVARDAGLPSVLVENFTWDWIYESDVGRCPRLAAHKRTLARIYAGVDVHIQAEPVCRPAPAALTAHPVARRVRIPRAKVRARVGVPADRRMVLVSLGGVSKVHTDIYRLGERPDLFFVVANAGKTRRAFENVLALDAFSGVYHPDLVGAADVLVGKAGYSTVAEACGAGIPFGYAARPDSRESEVLDAFIRKRLSGVALAPDAFETGSWIGRLDDLLSRPRPAAGADGAGQIAAFLEKRLAL